jgi:hypothetical protein
MSATIDAHYSAMRAHLGSRIRATLAVCHTGHPTRDLREGVSPTHRPRLSAGARAQAPSD